MMANPAPTPSTPTGQPQPPPSPGTTSPTLPSAQTTPSSAAPGNDTLNGGAGNDVLTGGTGNDTYMVDTTNDVITELKYEGVDTIKSPISWTLQANLENLTLTGATDINGTGNDKLTGGAGLDIFRFTTKPSANIDTLTDFTVADDTIQLENAIFKKFKTKQPQGN